MIDMTGAPIISTSATVYSPEWWMNRLSRELDDRAFPMQRFDDYYQGKHPMLYAGAKYRAAFGNLFAGFSDNFCGLVVDAVEERLDVEGFRMGADLEADDDAWRMWQENGMDAWSQIAHTEALVKGQCSILVSPDEEDDTKAEFTVQDALEMAVGVDRCSGDRLAALKRWGEDDGSVCFTLYLPDSIEKWRTKPAKGGTTATRTVGRYGLIPREVSGETWPLANPLGVVPVVPLVNRPRLRGPGVSEIRDVIPKQNALNKLFLDMLVASEFAAYRQRYAVGLELEVDPDTGKAVEPYKAGAGELWAEENPNVKFGEFEVTDLDNYRQAIELVVMHIASETRTPAHYFMGGQGSFPSGESLAASETGLTRKAERKQRFLGEGWEEVIRLGFLVRGDPRGKIMDSETIWRDPESRNEAAHVDSLVKLGSLGVPEEMLWEMAGLTPQQIERAKQIIAAAKAAEPPPPPIIVTTANPDPMAMDAMPPAAGGGRNGLPMMAATGAPDAPPK
jgi:hypothetical protein